MSPSSPGRPASSNPAPKPTRSSAEPIFSRRFATSPVYPCPRESNSTAATSPRCSPGEPRPRTTKSSPLNNEDVVGIRTQHWKYVEETYNRGSIVSFANRQYKQLYDATNDISESYSVADRYPDALLDMQTRLKQARETFAPFKKGVPPYFIKLRRQSHQD